MTKHSGENFSVENGKLRVSRVFTQAGVHPFDMFEWTKSDALIMDHTTGTPAFDQKDVEHPKFWKESSLAVCASHYLRGRLGTPEREVSFKQAFDRVATVIASYGYSYCDEEYGRSDVPVDSLSGERKRYPGLAVGENGFVPVKTRNPDGTYSITSYNPPLFFSAEDREVFRLELMYLLASSTMAFNSPVWYNVGIKETPQCSACFILSLDDNMASIRSWITRESVIFQGGSGSGLNVSNLRASMECIRGTSNTSSGPLEFMRWADSGAGAIRSGGATRRAAKMVVMDVDHPDIVQFVLAKKEAEDMGRALVNAGHSGGITGTVFKNLPFQNANQSIRVTDAFMLAVENDDWWALVARTDNWIWNGPDGEWNTVESDDPEAPIRVTKSIPMKGPRVVRHVRAKWLWELINKCSWDCGDPGLQFHDTINQWNTAAGYQDIRASNPCSEFMYLDDTSCNLASLNLRMFVSIVEGISTIDADKYESAVRLTITAQELLVSNSSYPSAEIDTLTKATRPLGAGYANLGALLMAMGIPYDSIEGRRVAAAFASALTGIGYCQSAKIAACLGAYDLYKNDESVQASQAAVLLKHFDATPTRKQSTDYLDALYLKGNKGFHAAWTACKDRNGVRNSQISVMAPTGTTSFLLQASSTGMEPCIGLTTYKNLVGGGTLTMTVDCVQEAIESCLFRYGIRRQDFTDEDLEDCCRDIALGHQVYDCLYDLIRRVKIPPRGGLEGWADYTRHVLTCALERDGISILPSGHVAMMAALQPFLSGAISKTVNMPNSATVQDVADMHAYAWKSGVKAVALYRDGCKIAQPVESKKTDRNVPMPHHPDDEDGEAYDDESDSPGQTARVPLPDIRHNTTTIKVRVGEFSFYVHVGRYNDGYPGEVFIAGKEGSTLGGLLSGIGRVMSVALQHGVPLEALLRTLAYQKFEPAGITNHATVRIAHSPLDALARILACEEGLELDGGDWSKIGDAEATAHAYDDESVDQKDAGPARTVAVVHDRVCTSCGSTKLVRAGSCYTCLDCGTSTGCG